MGVMVDQGVVEGQMLFPIQAEAELLVREPMEVVTAQVPPTRQEAEGDRVKRVVMLLVLLEGREETVIRLQFQVLLSLMVVAVEEQ